MSNITFLEEYTPEKTSDRFVEVIINYENYKWFGALPLRLKEQGFEITIENLKDKKNYSKYIDQIKTNNHHRWLEDHNGVWKKNINSQTHKVFKALLSHEWQCRVCGPVPKINPQSAARLRDIRKKNFVIASKRKSCKNCNAVTMNDILIPIYIPKTNSSGYRRNISSIMRKRIINVLKNRDCVFDVIRPNVEFIIDHKFPSQRWRKAESFNKKSMTDDEIKIKFQLLTNQTNMLKSRACDKCVFENKRPTFMGIKWFYAGDENWNNDLGEEQGCVGCPWYDVDRWKDELSRSLKMQN